MDIEYLGNAPTEVDSGIAEVVTEDLTQDKVESTNREGAESEYPNKAKARI